VLISVLTLKLTPKFISFFQVIHYHIQQPSEE